MGNSNHFELIDPTKHCKLVGQQEQYQIYEDEEGNQYQKYALTSEQYNLNENQYHFRIRQRRIEFVDVMYAGNDQHSPITCTRPTYVIITERIPFTLQNLPSLSTYNALNVLLTAMKGYQKLFLHHGLMSIKENMIGINSNNFVKVWLNSNFSLNQSEDLSIALVHLSLEDHQKQIVNNIFQLIASKAQNTQLWSQFLQSKHQSNPITFSQAINFIKLFSDSHQIHVTNQLFNPFNQNYGNAVKFTQKYAQSSVNQFPLNNFSQNNLKAINQSTFPLNYVGKSDEKLITGITNNQNLELKSINLNNKLLNNVRPNSTTKIQNRSNVPVRQYINTINNPKVSFGNPSPLLYQTNLLLTKNNLIAHRNNSFMINIEMNKDISRASKNDEVSSPIKRVDNLLKQVTTTNTINFSKPIFHQQFTQNKTIPLLAVQKTIQVSKTSQSASKEEKIEQKIHENNEIISPKYKKDQIQIELEEIGPLSKINLDKTSEIQKLSQKSFIRNQTVNNAKVEELKRQVNSTLIDSKEIVRQLEITQTIQFKQNSILSTQSFPKIQQNTISKKLVSYRQLRQLLSE